MIDAIEKRDTITVATSGPLFHTKMPKREDNMHVISDGRMADLLVKIQEYVHQRHRQVYTYIVV